MNTRALPQALGMGLHLAILALPVLAVRPPAAMDPALLGFWALVLLLDVSESGGVERPTSSTAVLPASLAAMSQLAVFWSGTFEHVLAGRAASPSQAMLGVLVFVSGIALRRASIRRLRERFLDEVCVLPGHRLETNGLYGVLRHPSETGLLCVGAGAALLLDSVAAGLVWLAAVVPSALVRVHLEDRMLATHFGPDFRAYSSRVGGLLPRWRARS